MESTLIIMKNPTLEKAVMSIVKKAHPKDLGEETSQLEDHTREVLEKYVKDCYHNLSVIDFHTVSLAKLSDVMVESNATDMSFEAEVTSKADGKRHKMKSVLTMDKEKVSSCCSANVHQETCLDCKEHCEEVEHE